MPSGLYTRTYSFPAYQKARGSEVKFELDAIAVAIAALPEIAKTLSGNYNYVIPGGTANALTIAMPTTWTTYTGKDGYRISIKATAANTGAVTVNVDSVGAVGLVRNDGTALSAGDLSLNNYYDMIYDETAGFFRLQTAAASYLEACEAAQAGAEAAQAAAEAAAGVGAIAKGSIWAGIGGNAVDELPVGADGHALIAASGEDTGMKWARITYQVSNVAASGSITAFQSVYANTTSGPVTMTGPSTLVVGDRFRLQNVGSGTLTYDSNGKTIIRGGATIGATTYALAQGEYLELVALDPAAVEIIEEPLDRATAASIRETAGTSLVTPGGIASAVARVALTDAASIALSWIAGINFEVVMAGNRELANPTDVVVGTMRTVLLMGNNGTNRTLTFASNYKGDLPNFTDIDDARWYKLFLDAIASDHIAVSWIRAL